MTRWIATIRYRGDGGPVDVTHDVEELAELHDLVERGPSWDAIEKIEIVLRRQDGRLTLEQAAVQ